VFLFDGAKVEATINKNKLFLFILNKDSLFRMVNKKAPHCEAFKSI
jgi:sRNA-binding regulator protein Hfq